MDEPPAHGGPQDRHVEDDGARHRAAVSEHQVHGGLHAGAGRRRVVLDNDPRQGRVDALKPLALDEPEGLGQRVVAHVRVTVRRHGYARRSQVVVNGPSQLSASWRSATICQSPVTVSDWSRSSRPDGPAG